jgi:D-3-phosphoglycerate dehydrogenase
MSTYQVVVTEDLFDEYREEVSVLSQVDAELIVFDCKDKSQLIEAVRSAHGVLMHTTMQIDSEVVNEMRCCRVISRYGIGYDNIDVEAATRAGIWVARVTEYGAEEDVADQAIALLMACIREVCYKNRRIREGGWNLRSERKIERIKGKTLGIIGHGNIGSSLHRKLSCIGLGKVLVCDPYKPEQRIIEQGGEVADLQRLLRESDYVSIHVPLGEKTHHMVGARELALMKSTAILINTSRGPIIDEAALCDALRNSRIRSAGIDVFEEEPLPTTSPLKQLDNVILSDHTGYYSEESLIELKTKAAQNIAEVLCGRRPLYALNELEPDKERKS